MLTAAERRFLRYWEEQRKGGRVSYYLLYCLVGTFIIAMLIFIVLIFFMQLRVSVFLLWFVPSVSFGLGAILTIFSWYRNQQKWKALIQREIEQSG